MSFKRNSIWILPLLVILTAPLWWTKAGDLLKPRGGEASLQPAAPPDGQIRTFVMDRVVLTHIRVGGDKFTVKAAHVRSGIHAEVLEMEEIEARLTGPDGRSTVLTGGEALYDTKRQIITVLDRVRVRTPNGQLMKTEALRYLVRFRKVKTAEDVWLGDEKLQVTGGNLLYDLIDGNFRVGGRVAVDFY
jgi:LPS export ABC transporter protein LptC